MEAADLVDETRAALHEAHRALRGYVSGGVMFNCILRRLEMDATGIAQPFLEAFGGLPMAGFHTYGETWMAHVNQSDPDRGRLRLTDYLIGSVTSAHSACSALSASSLRHTANPAAAATTAVRIFFTGNSLACADPEGRRAVRPRRHPRPYPGTCVPVVQRLRRPAERRRSTAGHA